MASTLRSAASGRTGASAGARSGGQTSGAVKKPVVVPKPTRILPKIIENNQDVTPKPLIDIEQFVGKVKDPFLMQDASSTVSFQLNDMIFKKTNILSNAY